MLRRFKCWLDFHDWVVIKVSKRGQPLTQKCSYCPTKRSWVVCGLADGRSPTNMNKNTRKKTWIIIEDDNKDNIKNRPEWTTEKEREKIVLAPRPPNPLEDWINNK